MGGGRQQGPRVYPAHSEHFRCTDTSEFKSRCLPVFFHVKCIIHRLTVQGRLSNWNPPSFPVLFPTTPFYTSSSSSSPAVLQTAAPPLRLRSDPPPGLDTCLLFPLFIHITPGPEESSLIKLFSWPFYFEVKSFSFEFLENNFVYSSIHTATCCLLTCLLLLS